MYESASSIQTDIALMNQDPCIFFVTTGIFFVLICVTFLLVSIGTKNDTSN